MCPETATWTLMMTVDSGGKSKDQELPFVVSLLLLVWSLLRPHIHCFMTICATFSLKYVQGQ